MVQSAAGRLIVASLLVFVLQGCASVSVPPPAASTQSHASSSTVVPAPSGTTADEWKTFSGDGYRIDYPGSWHAETVPPNVDQLISPTWYPFLEITVLCGWETGTCSSSYSAADLAVIWGFAEADAQQSELAIGGEAGVVIRFHSTGDTGIVYYRIPAFVVHASVPYKLELISKAGSEQAADELSAQFLSSLTFTS